MQQEVKIKSQYPLIQNIVKRMLYKKSMNKIYIS